MECVISLLVIELFKKPDADLSQRFGSPISIDPYKEQFFSDVEGGPRAAVKRLTRTIERELVEATINAPDWQVI